MSGLDAFAVDVDKEENGTWMPVGDDMEFKISRLGSKSSQKELRRRKKDVYGVTRRGLKRAEEGDEDGEIVKWVIVKTCVHGWRTPSRDNKDVVLVGGDEILYTAESRDEILMDPKYRPLYEEIATRALEEDRFLEAQMENDSEKLKKSPSGKASMAKS